MKTIKDLKEEIKQMSAEQRFVKDCRKTVHRKPEYTLHSGDAQIKAKMNKRHLRSMFIAYGLMRGKMYNQIEDKPKTTPDWNLIEKYKENYGEVVYSNPE